MKVASHSIASISSSLERGELLVTVIGTNGQVIAEVVRYYHTPADDLQMKRDAKITEVVQTTLKRLISRL